MDGLVQWLRAQLDEDERIARAVEDRSAPWEGQWVADGGNAARTFNGHVLFYGHNAPLKKGLVAHVVRHDPARVLRDIEAKRRTVDDCEGIIVGFHHEESKQFARDVLRNLAEPYADRPGYREEWKP